MLSHQVPNSSSTPAPLASPIFSNPDILTVTEAAPTPDDPASPNPFSQPHAPLQPWLSRFVAPGPLLPEFWRRRPLTVVGIDSLSVKWPEHIADNFDQLQGFLETFEQLLWTGLGPPIGSERAAWHAQTTTWLLGATLTKSPLGGRLIIPRSAADQFDVHTMLGFVRIAMSNPLATIDGLEVSADLKSSPELLNLVRRSCEAGHFAPMTTWREVPVTRHDGLVLGTCLQLGAKSASLSVELATSNRVGGALTWRARYRGNRAADLGRRLAASHTAFPDLRHALASAVDFDERGRETGKAHRPAFVRALHREILTGTERRPLRSMPFWENLTPPMAG